MKLMIIGIVFFIAGILFRDYIFPLLDILLEIIDTKKTALVTRIAVGINEDQIKIKKAQEEIEPSCAQAIGFQYTEPESEFIDFPEEDKLQRRIGY